MAGSNVLFSVWDFILGWLIAKALHVFAKNLSEGVSSPFPDPSCANTKRCYYEENIEEARATKLREISFVHELWHGEIAFALSPGIINCSSRRTSWLLLKRMMENGTFQINEPNIFHSLRSILQHPARILFLSWRGVKNSNFLF